MTELGGLTPGPGSELGPVPGWIDIERRLVAVMAMDVAGYSRLMGQDEVGTFTRMRDLMRGLVAPAVTEAGGIIVKGTGDGAIVTFPAAAAAVRCA
ncbi:MAG: adenylate/guanylate cyclase domain-containing protein, partial [Gemmatimonadaceae bacterium]|nr:adenylate/guanylate cyclase domain-containing protein [Acetobacteraceae bacterium]